MSETELYVDMMKSRIKYLNYMLPKWLKEIPQGIVYDDTYLVSKVDDGKDLPVSSKEELTSEMRSYRKKVLLMLHPDKNQEDSSVRDIYNEIVNYDNTSLLSMNNQCDMTKESIMRYVKERDEIVKLEKNISELENSKAYVYHTMKFLFLSQSEYDSKLARYKNIFTNDKTD